MKILIMNNELINRHSPKNFLFDDSSSTKRILILVVEELSTDALLEMFVVMLSLEEPTSDSLVVA